MRSRGVSGDLKYASIGFHMIEDQRTARLHFELRHGGRVISTMIEFHGQSSWNNHPVSLADGREGHSLIKQQSPVHRSNGRGTEKESPLSTEGAAG